MKLSEVSYGKLVQLEDGVSRTFLECHIDCIESFNVLLLIKI